MVGKCIVSSCGKAASKCCGSCRWVQYCGIECQREDWKKGHKKFECVNMKKLSSVYLTEEEINVAAYRITSISDRLSANGEYERSTDVLKECIVFAQDRLGQLDCSHSDGMIGDGVKLNYIVICHLLVELGEVYFRMPSSSETDNHAISYLSEARELLIQRKDAGKDDMIMFKLLLSCDNTLCGLYSRMQDQLEKAKYHALQFVATARQYKGPDHVDLLIAALSKLSALLQHEYKCPEALAVSEEAYLIASKNYSPAHRTVLKASRQMISCLIEMKDYSTADTYCRMSNANVFDPMNAGEYDTEDRACTMGQLVDIWLVKEPDDDEIVEKALADEAIDLSRKAYALREERCHALRHFDCLSILCRVLLKANQLNEETEGLLHQLAKTHITNISLTASINAVANLGDFYSKLHKSLPMGEKSTLVQENIELCCKRLFELKSCNDDSIGCVKGSQKIKPYFKNNAELCI